MLLTLSSPPCDQYEYTVSLGGGRGGAGRGNGEVRASREQQHQREQQEQQKQQKQQEQQEQQRPTHHTRTSYSLLPRCAGTHLSSLGPTFSRFV